MGIRLSALAKRFARLPDRIASTIGDIKVAEHKNIHGGAQIA